MREKGYAVKIMESASLGLTFPQTVEGILQAKTDFVGISCTTSSVDNAGKIAQAVKEASPETLIFVGGPHITALPVETFRRYPSFDFGIVGEGERAFTELLETLEGNGDLRKAPSAVFREGLDIIINPRRKFIENLDRLPFPAFDLLPHFPRGYRPPFLNYLWGPCASLITSRGCPQGCTFCDRAVFGNRYRHFSEGYIVELVGHLKKKYKIRHLVFADDQFTASKVRLMRLCEGLLEKNLEIRWNCDARVDTVDSEMLKMMKKAGCWMVSYGVESGSQEILNRVHKEIRLDQAEETVRRTKEAGLRAKGLFMVGYPEETEETLQKTLDFILRCPFDEINLSILTPYPGTAIYEEFKKQAGFIEDWSRMNAMNLLHLPQNLSAEVLAKKYRRILRKFYMRPGVTFSYLGVLLQSPENCARLVAALGGKLSSLFRSPTPN